MKFYKFAIVFLLTSSVSMGNPIMFPALGQLAILDTCSGGGSQVFSYTGSLQNFTVPAGCKYITIKAWGAGGGGGATASGGTGNNGGASGYAYGLLPVVSGQSIDIYVGGGGAAGSTSGNGSWATASGGGYPDGGGRTATAVAAGGGSTRIVRSSTVVMVAGAGGGGGQGGGVGAVGGGSTAANGSGVAPGGGGSQSAGGAGGGGSINYGSAGGYLAGGSTTSQSFGGTGGGGGYYGGGSGGSNYGSGAGAGGGGGGSGYVDGVGNSTNSAGSGTTPPNSADSDYAAGIGVGGTGGASPTAGGNGRVKIYWGKSDIYYANVSLYLHMDGANNGTTFTDSSSSPKTVTVNGGAVTSTAVQVNGSAVASFNGTNAYLTCPTGAGFQLPGDFTVEMWVYPTSNTVQNRDYEFFATGATNASAAGIQFQFSGNGGRLPRFVTNGAVLIQGATAVPLNTWTHLAAVRSGTTVTFYVNGTSVGTATSATNFSDGQCWIGTGGGGSTNYYYGYIDELRVTKGVARYTGNFTPGTLFPNF